MRHRRPEFWLITVPLKIVSVLLWWSSVFWTAMWTLAAITLPIMALAMLVLWFGFGIRWGW